MLNQILDVDSHEMAPLHLWGPVFGAHASKIADVVEPMMRQTAEADPNSFYNPALTGDTAEISPASAWNTKGTGAPGAFDCSRRLRVMDAMGIRRQLVFPSFALVALALMSEQTGLRNYLRVRGDTGMSNEEYEELGRAGLDDYNRWAAISSAIDPDRLRVVGYVGPSTTVDELMCDTTALIESGLRVIHIPHGVPPGGHSPAHPDLDDFWRLLTDHDVVCTTHLMGEANFIRSTEWINAPAFAPGKVQSHEIGLEPYSFATLHLPISNFLACMTLGGVFERHPKLRFGVIELGSAWFGPLADSLDMWARDMYASRLAPFISKLPSEYLRDQVRVTPFNVFEPVDEYIRRYPHLADCYCYSTDYPHREGGKESVKIQQYDRIAELGDGLAENFFEKNGGLLLPDFVRGARTATR